MTIHGLAFSAWSFPLWLFLVAARNAEMLKQQKGLTVVIMGAIILDLAVFCAINAVAAAL
jgi:hypothetical protein